MTGFMPLYAQVRAALVERLSAGEWAPGTALPSEMALAEQCGVSQGTARKAIDSLVADGALIRSQGRGTFVAEQTPELANFRFLPLIGADANRVIPDLARQIILAGQASERVASALGVESGSPIHTIERIRRIDGKRAIFEQISVPVPIMPGLGDQPRLPNALYPHYQSVYGISVLRTEDKLQAVAASERTARFLACTTGAPLLQAERVAFDLTDRAVEHRISQFLTNAYAYAVNLR